jgi:hypothetical protein
MTMRWPLPELPPPAFAVGDVAVYFDPWCPNDGRLRYYAGDFLAGPFVVASHATAATLMQRNLAAAYRPEGVP